jgi:hypothetical protein
VASKHKRSHLAVSLFPFLSILCCVIGTLTGIFASAQGASDSDEYVRLLAKRDETLRECSELERRTENVTWPPIPLRVPVPSRMDFTEGCSCCRTP